MEALFHLRDYGYEHLTELTLDGLLLRLTETTWVRRGAVLAAEDRMAALRTMTPPGLVLSHDSAWWVHSGLGRAPSPLSFITHPRRRFVSEVDYHVHELTLAEDEWELLGGHPVTTEMRTLYDLLLPHLRGPMKLSGQAPSTGHAQQTGDAQQPEYALSTAPTQRSAQTLRNLIAELPGDTRTRFRCYLAGISRRPFVSRMRTVFESLCAATGRN